MIWTLIVLALLLLTAMVVWACCKVSADCTREEEEEHPCANCLRWSECNGVDDDCPIRR